MTESLVIMGVAGCGKSSLGAAIAADRGMTLAEGDDFHSAHNLDKMRRAIPLTDADRQGWLALLAGRLAAHPHGLVVTCSALRRVYRDQLRGPVPSLRFVFLDISRDAARSRLQARSGHFFSPSLIDSQFETLEPPVGDPGVLRLDALAPLSTLRAEVSEWLTRSQA